MNTDHSTPVIPSEVEGPRDATSGPAPEDLSVNALVVCCQCSDGKMRAVQFDKGGKQAKQVHGYIRHICGGRLKLHKEPLVLVQLDEAAAPAKPTSEVSLPAPKKVSPWRTRFTNLKSRFSS
jgi:hypothetical protein